MKVELLGTSFTLQSDEPPEYLETVMNFYSSKVDEIRSSVDTGDPVKLAILAGILVVDELLKAKTAEETSGESPAPSEPRSSLNFSVEELDEAERITLELIDKIGTTLEEAALKKSDPED